MAGLVFLLGRWNSGLGGESAGRVARMVRGLVRLVNSAVKVEYFHRYKEVHTSERMVYTVNIKTHVNGLGT